jgi:hypothetical protein
VVSLGGGCLTWGRGVAVVVQVSALFHIASSKEPPHMPPSVTLCWAADLTWCLVGLPSETPDSDPTPLTCCSTTSCAMPR